MAWSKEQVECPFCSKSFSKEFHFYDEMLVDEDYINCPHCKNRIYVGMTDVVVTVVATKPMGCD